MRRVAKALVSSRVIPSEVEESRISQNGCINPNWQNAGHLS
jgi:hypothetical protein